VTQYTP